MAPDDASLDSTIIGDDLVEALGYEPLAVDRRTPIESEAPAATGLSLPGSLESAADAANGEAVLACDERGLVSSAERDGEGEREDEVSDAVAPSEAPAADSVVVEADDAASTPAVQPVVDEHQVEGANRPARDEDTESEVAMGRVIARDTDSAPPEDEPSTGSAAIESGDDVEIIADDDEKREPAPESSLSAFAVSDDAGLETNRLRPRPRPRKKRGVRIGQPRAEAETDTTSNDTELEGDPTTVDDLETPRDEVVSGTPESGVDAPADVAADAPADVAPTIDVDDATTRAPVVAPAPHTDTPDVEPASEPTVEPVPARARRVGARLAERGRPTRVRARKARRVVRHIDPWSVMVFSIFFHLCFFTAMFIASVLVWNVAVGAGTIENIENFIRELGDLETFEIDSDAVFRAAVLIAAILTLASTIMVVLLTVVFNLISDLVGGIRLTVIEEETVRPRFDVTDGEPGAGSGVTDAAPQDLGS